MTNITTPTVCHPPYEINDNYICKINFITIVISVILRVERNSFKLLGYNYDFYRTIILYAILIANCDYNQIQFYLGIDSLDSTILNHQSKNSNKMKFERNVAVNRLRFFSSKVHTPHMTR